MSREFYKSLKNGVNFELNVYIIKKKETYLIF